MSFTLKIEFPLGAPSRPRFTQEWVEELWRHVLACDFHTQWYLSSRVAWLEDRHPRRLWQVNLALEKGLEVSCLDSALWVQAVLIGDLMRAIEAGRDWV